MNVGIMGVVPAWMVGSTVHASAEDEWVEMIASLLYYGRNVRGIQFSMVSAMNETDLGPPEGPKVDAAQYVRLQRKLLQRLAALGMGDIGVVGPDSASVRAGLSTYWPAMLADEALMAQVHHFSLHDYSGLTPGAHGLLESSPYADRGYWMTEWAGRCDGCDGGRGVTDEWSFARQATTFLLNHLDDGASAALFYDAYDTYYVHHNSESQWGLLSYDSTTRTYAPRKRFFAIAQIFKFVSPGSTQLSASVSSPEIRASAFFNERTGQLTIVGLNTGRAPVTITGTLAGLTQEVALQVFQSTATMDVARAADVPVVDGTFTVEVAADSIFTLTTEGVSARAP